MSTDLSTWALPRISRLLPIDSESLKEVITYSASLSKEEAVEHLQNILGDSPQALEFISSFNARRQTAPAKPTPAKPTPAPITESPGVRPPQKKKVKPPLHSAGPLRQPEGYGNVTGGYHKSKGVEKEYAGPSATKLSNALSLSRQPVLQVPQVFQQAKTPSVPSSRDPSPPRSKSAALSAAKLPPSASSGSLISDYLPNVKSKQSKKSSHSHGTSGTSSLHLRPGATTTSSITDLTAAIAALELSTNPSLSSERRKCPCNASIHPLFTTAPNCLSCGKIICALEGLQPCSFCDSPILTKDQVSEMIRTLKEERGQERMAAHNASASGSGRETPIFGSKTPESGGSGDEASAAALRARAHRDKLLSFQRENKQRTTIHDEAADYDVTLTPGTTQWMSPVQRAAALKKQQHYMREMEEANKPEYEKRKTVMSMSIKNGKLMRTYQNVKSQSTPALEEDEDVSEEVHEDGESSRTAGKGAFSNNPLLVSGKLIRPLWKGAEDAKGKDKDDVARKSVWRRVQDDNEDNEQWILDGGMRGFEADK